MTTHRHIQIAALSDLMADKRRSYYSAAIKAGWINNRGASSYFTNRAYRCEQIRIRCMRRLFSMEAA